MPSSSNPRRDAEYEWRRIQRERENREKARRYDAMFAELDANPHTSAQNITQNVNINIERERGCAHGINSFSQFIIVVNMAGWSLLFLAGTAATEPSMVLPSIVALVLLWGITWLFYWLGYKFYWVMLALSWSLGSAVACVLSAQAGALLAGGFPY